jgi:hypothetical protein
VLTSGDEVALRRLFEGRPEPAQPV